MRVLAYAQLLRVPNVFTAFADILLAGLAAGTLAARPLPSAFLLFASGCLYCSGMVWNDWFDLETDRRERPFRPLPSGKIAPRTALLIALGLMTAGLLSAGLAGQRPLIAASLLAAAILAYDGWLKRTVVGTGAMGMCRLLNVMLGLSLALPGSMTMIHKLHLAFVVGLYIEGVTRFARHEAGRSSRTQLGVAAAEIAAALVLALALPTRLPEGAAWVGFPYALTAFGFVIGVPLWRAIADPEPKRVQAAVKACVLGLVLLDAVTATVYAGPWGLLIALLLPPALLLGRRVYST